MRRLIFLALMLSSCQAHAAKGTCFPKANFTIAATEKSGITEQQFNEVLDLVIAKWEPVVQANGANLVFRRLWQDGTLNSDTSVVGKDWVINSYGGLARHKDMTADGYAIVACHELGHHLGGAPLYTGEEWASTEGASDYFATLQCAKAIWPADENFDERVKAASLSVARVLADLGREEYPSLVLSDKHVVTRTYEGHPKAQCRLDTMAAGLFCNAAYTPLSKVDPKVGSCHEYTPKAQLGSRPRCWFAP